MILSPHEIAWLVVHRWSRPQGRLIMTCICLAESGGDTEALGRSSDPDVSSFGQRDHGLAQISGRWCGDLLAEFAAAGRDWRDPRANLDMARRVYDERAARGARVGDMGNDPFDAWATYLHDTWRRWIPDARYGLAAPFAPPIYRPAGLSAGATFRLEEGNAHG